METIVVHNRQRGINVDIAALQIFAERALRLVLKCRVGKGHQSRLSQIHVVLVSDRRMSALHRRFFQIDGPTDVITFQHGEILVSVETARRQARRFRTLFDDELRLYVVHGLLHLRGFDDKIPSQAKGMHALQERIAREAIKERRAPGRRLTQGRSGKRPSLKRPV